MQAHAHPAMKAKTSLLIFALLSLSALAQEESLIERGQKVAAKAFGLMSQNLMREMTTGGPQKAIPFCNENVGDLTEKVAGETQTLVQRVSHKPRNPANRASAEELKLIESYASAIKAGEQVKARTVKNAQGEDVFYAPIVMTMDVCLKCHGAPEKEVAAQDMERIRQLYPADAATGFQLGEIRGLWKITFKKP